MSSPLEKNITKRILEYLRSLPGCRAMKRHGGLLGEAGEPDIYGSLGGFHFEIEVKRPGAKLTPRQAAALEKWAAAGAVTGIVRSVAETKTLIESHFPQGGPHGQRETEAVRP